jgi:nucleotide-binding universal stress UspA family protein
MIQKILVGSDGSRQSGRAFSYALQLAQWSGAQLHAVAVVHGPDIEMAEPDERERLVARANDRSQALLEELRGQAAENDVVLQTHLLEGHPVERLLELAWNEDFDHIVVGHRSKGMFERLLMGSVAKRVVDFARCTVTVVR